MDYSLIKKFIDGLTVSDLKGMTHDQLQLINHHKEQIKYNKIDFFNPYPFQLKMFEAGLEHRARFACLANRVGKTFSAAAEVSYHATGRYPSWWTGIRYDYPPLIWCIGITTDSTRKVLQLEIFGTESAKDLDAIGTGSVPRDAIDFELLNRDGNTIKTAKVKHISGGYSTIDFRSTQQGVHTLMGSAVDFILCDEESPHNSKEIFSQCTTRTGSIEKGRVLITATPENGMSELIEKFYNEDELFIFHAGWDDAPHLTEKVKAELISTYSEWEIPMRTKGIPSKGSGAIFKVEDSEITIDPLIPLPHWPVIASVDFGRTRDPNVVVWTAYNPDDDIIIIYKVDVNRTDRSLEVMADTILSEVTKGIPVMTPHDGSNLINDQETETRKSLLYKLGCNVISQPFNNPPEIQHKITNVYEKTKGKNGGLIHMEYLMKHGRLKVCSDCVPFFQEKLSYFWVEKNGKTVPKDGNDDVMDASRYGVLSVQRYGAPFGECQMPISAGSYLTDSNLIRKPRWY